MLGRGGWGGTTLWGCALDHIHQGSSGGRDEMLQQHFFFALYAFACADPNAPADCTVAGTNPLDDVFCQARNSANGLHVVVHSQINGTLHHSDLQML